MCRTTPSVGTALPVFYIFDVKEHAFGTVTTSFTEKALASNVNTAWATCALQSTVVYMGQVTRACSINWYHADPIMLSK